MPWSMWTYKMMMPHAAKNVWGLYRNDKASQALDVTRDSAAELERKIALMRTEHLQPVPGQIEMFQQVAAASDAKRDDEPARQGLRARLSRLALQVQDRLCMAWAALADALESRTR